MRFPPHFLDEIRARLAVSQVVGRRVQLKKAGREWKGLSPFKTERTPSFFVNDQKGFYKCFASGEFGDIFTFVMKTEGLSFGEAVERLAGEAGLALPKPVAQDAEEAGRRDERTRLLGIIDASVAYFEAALKGPAGREARKYLERRGLTAGTIARFRLGYAPAGRGALRAHLSGLGYSIEEQVASGMLIGGEDIAEPYDRFRDRVMFPIEDLKGRAIAFGGRALSADAPAKYLNSPETPLFHKGGLLYNAHRARQAGFESTRLVVVEGYMDVLALDQAGFPAAVAPLGTALTEAQVQILWRVVPEPILCFDGDAAGRKAAFRAVDVILPLLKPGHSARFVFLPDGLDPDDLARQQGAEGVARALEGTRALFDVLWEREESAHPLTTPEQRAAFEQRLKGCIGHIADPNVRSHYDREARQTLWSWGKAIVRQTVDGRGVSGGRTPGRRNNVQTDWRIRERNQARAASGARGGGQLPADTSATTLSGRSVSAPTREALILKTLLNHPWMIEEHSEQLAEIELTHPSFNELRAALLDALTVQIPLDSASLRDHLSDRGLSHVLALVERAITHKGDHFAEPEADRDAVNSGWCHAVALHERKVGLARDLAMAERRWLADQSEEAFERLCEIKALQGQVERTE